MHEVELEHVRSCVGRRNQVDRDDDACARGHRCRKLRAVALGRQWLAVGNSADAVTSPDGTTWTVRCPSMPGCGSANLYGGTGNGINEYAKEKERRAAWLFLVWSTSPEAQLEDLKSKVGGGTPTRQSVYDLPEARAAEEKESDMPNMLSAKIACLSCEG